MFRAPNDKDYDVLLAENRFVTDIQLVIEKALGENDMSQADLARALGVSEARISQILGGNGKNLEARTIAKIAHILGLRADIEFRDSREARSCAGVEASDGKFSIRIWASRDERADEFDWNHIANDDEGHWARAA